jgi:hypothetical protein
METYRESGVAVRHAREAYEKALLEAGAGDLTQNATVDGDGHFSLEGIPAGEWVLLAARSKYIAKAPQERPGAAGALPRETRPPLPFVPPDKLGGYSLVTYWLRELTVVAGVAETIQLTDRNVWLTGVIENREAPRLPDLPYQPRR